MKLISYSDFIELREKMLSTQLSFFLKKLQIVKSKRSQAHWNETYIPPTNWWNIPAVRDRWNQKITGNPTLSYVDYLINNYCIKWHRPRMLSVGCGTGSQEILFCQTHIFEKITAIDFAENNIQTARSKTNDPSLHFIHSSFEAFQTNESFDLILFHSSLHHLNNLENVMLKLQSLLKKDGLIIIHEYTGPNRINWNREQLAVCNKLLKSLPPTHNRFFASGKTKRKQTAPGWIRMVLSDPSEAVESQAIIPLLQIHFQELELKGYGGNILTPLLKGISHHFIENNSLNTQLLELLFKAEDEFLLSHTDDYHFGIYKKRG